MAQYKVPQDVEADDKLIGPFSFRQFVYLLVAAGLIALAVGLFQIFPLLAIIPLPPVLLFLALALPLKKDQPMDTYLAALVSYYLKPRKRFWTPGQRESTILITAPKIIEEVRTRDISSEEATHRLSFLADIVDTGGYAIKGASNNNMREDFVAEANATMDMFDNYRAMNINRAISDNKEERHEEVIKNMREAIDRNNNLDMSGAILKSDHGDIGSDREKKNTQLNSSEGGTMAETIIQSELPKNNEQIQPKSSIMELANNSDFTVATIAKEANRINRKDEDEIFISLH